MLYKGIKSKAAIFTVLAMLGAASLSVLTNTTTLAQAESDSKTIYPCIANNIRLYIILAKYGYSSAFNKLVACNSKAIPYLAQALESKDENIRIISTAALGEVDSNAAALPYLTKSLKDNSKEARIIAVDALGKIGKDAIPALITALKDENFYVHSSAVDALGKIGKDAVPALITALKDGDIFVRWSAADALIKIGKDAVPALITALKDENFNVIRGAAGALGQIGIKEKDEVGQLSKIFLDKNENICSRYHTIKLLRKIDSEEANTVIKNNKRIADYIYDNVSHWCIHSYIPPIPSGRFRDGTSDHLRNKPPVMCRIPVIKNLLAWKCSKANF
ncbi:HEAT domain protein repeat-containing protein [Calothrix parasitica NIES-267]|uniref:HEAT domain protein repeat-containing protein n=1 Tax=Calothrix parasitica NIES-267 TaxID=1973488 RepID=A0A1Z4M073_9CYAN|nr:HEAT domain protein repeat-containing protein [Calothrix parasitica NIES-267]